MKPIQHALEYSTIDNEVEHFQLQRSTFTERPVREQLIPEKVSPEGCEMESPQYECSLPFEAMAGSSQGTEILNKVKQNKHNKPKTSPVTRLYGMPIGSDLKTHQVCKAGKTSNKANKLLKQ